MDRIAYTLQDHSSFAQKLIQRGLAIMADWIG